MSNTEQKQISMLKEFPKAPRHWVLPMSSSLKDALTQAQADAVIYAQSGEPQNQLNQTYRRRNALVICSPSILRTVLITEAFRGMELFMLDWKGRQFTREEIDTSILSSLSKRDKSSPITICIFDAELMDQRQMQTVIYCIENAPEVANFVILTSSPHECKHLKKMTSIIFNCVESCAEENYKAAAKHLFNSVFKREAYFDLDGQFLIAIENDIAKLSPDMLTLLATSTTYAYFELLVKNNFHPVQDGLKLAFEIALHRTQQK